MTHPDNPAWNDNQDWQDERPQGRSDRDRDDNRDSDIPWSGQQGSDIPNVAPPDGPWQKGAEDIPNYLPNWITKPPIENSNPPSDENGMA